MVAVTVARPSAGESGRVERAADALMAPNPAGRSCRMCEGSGWVSEWNRSCPSDRHRSELELTWWAFEDGFEQLQAARRRARARQADAG